MRLMTDAGFRAQAAQHAAELLSEMWTANPGQRANLYSSSAATPVRYNQWLARIQTGSVALPGISANPPQVTVLTQQFPYSSVGAGSQTVSAVTITIFWQSPGVTTANSYTTTVIAMIASLAVFQAVSVSEARKRSTSSGSEGLQAGVFGLASLERAIANAGYNLMVVSDPGYTSPVRLVTPGTGYTLSTTNPPKPEFHIGCNFTVGGTVYRAAPIVATDGGAGLASDTLIVFSGSSANVPLPASAETGGLAAGSSTIRHHLEYADGCPLCSAGRHQPGPQSGTGALQRGCRRLAAGAKSHHQRCGPDCRGERHLDAGVAGHRSRQ